MKSVSQNSRKTSIIFHQKKIIFGRQFQHWRHFIAVLRKCALNIKFRILKTTRIYKGFATLFLVGVKMLEMKFPKPPIKRGRRSCREMALKDYFTLDADIEIERIVETIAIKSGIPRSKIVAEEIMRLKEEGKIIIGQTKCALLQTKCAKKRFFSRQTKSV